MTTTHPSFTAIETYLAARGLRFAKAGEDGSFLRLPREFGTVAYSERRQVWVVKA